HGDHPTGLQVEKGFGSVGRAGVDVAKLLGIVSTDGQQRQFGRQAASNFAKAGKVGGISCMINRVLAAAQHIATVTAVRIFNDARSPMSRRDVSDVEGAMAISVPPFQFDNPLVAEIEDQIEQVM